MPLEINAQTDVVLNVSRLSRITHPRVPRVHGPYSFCTVGVPCATYHNPSFSFFNLDSIDSWRANKSTKVTVQL